MDEYARFALKALFRALMWAMVSLTLVVQAGRAEP